jgi:ribosomal protein S11
MGVAYSSTFNSTIISIIIRRCRRFGERRQGRIRGSGSTPFAAQVAADSRQRLVAQDAPARGLGEGQRGAGGGDPVLQAAGMEILASGHHADPHNGCRPPKRRRQVPSRVRLDRPGEDSSRWRDTRPCAGSAGGRIRLYLKESAATEKCGIERRATRLASSRDRRAKKLPTGGSSAKSEGAGSTASWARFRSYYARSGRRATGRFCSSSSDAPDSTSIGRARRRPGTAARAPRSHQVNAADGHPFFRCA